MDKCPYISCGEELKLSPNFCSSCNEKIIICPTHSCSAPNRSLASFCWNCGKELKEPADWRMYKANPQLTGCSSMSFYPPPPDIESSNPQWSINIAAKVFSSLITAYGYLFILSKDGNVHIIKQSNGKKISTISLEEPHESVLTPAISNKTLFVALSKSLYAYKLTPLANNEAPIMLWRTQSLAENEIFATNVLMENDKVFMGSFDRRDTKIYAIDPKTSRIVWEQRLNGKSSSFALKDNKLILTTKDRIYAININTGDQLWNASISEEVIVNIPPVISGDLIYFFNSKNRLCLLNLHNGIPAAMLGNIEVTGVNSFSLSSSAIFITSGIGRVFKYSISGGLIWSWENRGIAGVDSITSYPVVSERTMITGSGMGYLYIFDLTSSTCQVTIKRTFTKAIRSSPAISDSRMFVCSVDGELYAYA